MYLIPGYVDYEDSGNSLIVSSQLLQNRVEIEEPTYIREFDTIVKCGGCNAVSSQLTKFLHEQELLLTKEEIYDSIARAKDLLLSKLIITILPTESCNFRCPYCYESHDPIFMSSDILLQIWSFIAEQAPKHKEVQLSWFGGEPTLCKSKVVKTGLFVKNLQQSSNFIYKSSMTTNGYLLDMNSFKEYYAAGITKYQITLDGFGHDKTRPLLSGCGTLDVILKNLLDISALPNDEFDFHIILRHNLLENDHDLSWYDYLSRLFGKDKRFYMMIRAVKDWGGTSVKDLDLLNLKAQVEFLAEHESYLQNAGLQLEPDSNTAFSHVCYACLPHGFVFRADGRIEKCTIALNQPQNMVGVVDASTGVFIDENQNRRWYEKGLRSECYTCKQLLSCLNMQCGIRAADGDCPYRVLES